MVFEWEKVFLLCLWVASKLRYFGPCFLIWRDRCLQIHTLSFPFLHTASTKAGVCYVQHAMALPSVEQEPPELTRARADCCGQRKNQHVHQTIGVLIGYSSTSPVSASVSQEGAHHFLGEWRGKFRGRSPRGKYQLQCCCGCMSAPRGLAQSIVPGFIWVRLETVLVRLREAP